METWKPLGIYSILSWPAYLHRRLAYFPALPYRGWYESQLSQELVEDHRD